MEAESSESEDQDIFAGIELPENETGSEYEDSDIDEKRKSKNHEVQRSRETRSISNDQIRELNDVDEDVALSSSDRSKQVRNVESLADMRHSHTDRNSRKRKDSPVKPFESATKRSKRPGAWLLHPKYRDLLNNDIADTVSGNISDDNILLKESQIGLTMWTATEKDQFFISLSRLGRNSVKAIAARIGTKSEPEVQEYMQLLHHGFVEKRIRAKVFQLPDFPAATEISQECCEQLERTADAFVAVQEAHEISLEKEKWGDSWLLTPEVSHWLNKRRNQKGGFEAVEGVLPSANLFDVEKWLQLSRDVFMNPAAPHEQENWEQVADEGEVPAIRATALEDFHSLTVFITKKLISTTLYCTMSRLRAAGAQKVKHAEVHPADVTAALEILKMSRSSENYWKNCPRRCHLHIIDDEVTSETPRDLTYDEVEAALSADTTTHRRPRSRSRSRSRSLATHGQRTGTPTPSDPSIVESEDSQPLSSPLSRSRSRSHSSSAISDHISPKASLKRAQDREAYNTAVETYTESLDQQASLTEELRLWGILKKDLPAGVLERVDQVQTEAELTRPTRLENEYDDRYSWREWVGYKSEWEDMGGRVGEEEFERNSKITRKRRLSEDSLESGKLESNEEYSGAEAEDYHEDDELDHVVEEEAEPGERAPGVVRDGNEEESHETAPQSFYSDHHQSFADVYPSLELSTKPLRAGDTVEPSPEAGVGKEEEDNEDEHEPSGNDENTAVQYNYNNSRSFVARHEREMDEDSSGDGHDDDDRAGPEHQQNEDRFRRGGSEDSSE